MTNLVPKDSVKYSELWHIIISVKEENKIYRIYNGLSYFWSNDFQNIINSVLWSIKYD